MGAIGSWELLIIVIVVLILAYLVKSIFGGSCRQGNPDTRAEMNDLYDLANRLERRIENLETILTDRSGATRENHGLHAADGSD